MLQFIFIYIGGQHPADPEEGQKHFAKYQQWLVSLGDAVVSPAIPFKDTHTVHPDSTVEPGTTSAMSGMSIINAESMDAAIKIAQSCPFLEINGTLEISEMIEMSSKAN